MDRTKELPSLASLTWKWTEQRSFHHLPPLVEMTGPIERVSIACLPYVGTRWTERRSFHRLPPLRGAGKNEVASIACLLYVEMDRMKAFPSLDSLTWRWTERSHFRRLPPLSGDGLNEVVSIACLPYVEMDRTKLFPSLAYLTWR